MSASGESKWTWLIYLAGDNNLQSQAIASLDEMKQAESVDGLNVIAELTTEADTTKRIRVGSGKLTTLQELPQIDTGKEESLIDFINWGRSQFPAERYAVVVWNHGNGLEDLPLEMIDWTAMRGVNEVRRAVASRAVFRATQLAVLQRAYGQYLPTSYNSLMIAADVAHRDYLDNQSFRSVFESGHAGPVAILGCDACLMNTIEIAYEMRGAAAVLVGSEQTEPPHGWAYREIFSWMRSNLGASSEDIAKAAVDAYGAYYARERQDWTTQSAISLGRPIEDAADSVKAFADALIAALPNAAGGLALARNSVVDFEGEYADLDDLAANISERVPIADVRRTAADVRAAVKAAVIANRTTGDAMASAAGLSIWFPRAPLHQLVDVYAKLQFASRTGWLNVLSSYHAS